MTDQNKWKEMSDDIADISKKIKSTKTINVFIKSSTLKKFLSKNSLLILIKIFKVKNTNKLDNA